MANACVLCSAGQEEVVHASEKWRVLLVDDADYPGFCRVIWNSHVAEMTDLAETDRTELMRVVWLVESCVRTVMQPDKVNLASLGNMVPHIHWHIIPRYANDRNFPDSIWSAARRDTDGSDKVQRIGKVPALRKTLADTLCGQYGPSRK